MKTNDGRPEVPGDDSSHLSRREEVTEVGLLGIDRPPTVLLAVIASTFFVGFGGGVVFPILPNLGAVLGISAFMVGVILSANRWVRSSRAPAGAFSRPVRNA